MPRRRVELSPSAKEVSELIRKGKLFEVEAWVKSDKSLKMSELGLWSSMLNVAVDTGFHSLVKVVINGEKWEYGATYGQPYRHGDDAAQLGSGYYRFPAA